MLAATRCNPVFRAHFQQLRERGKAFKVAMMACMRKLLTILNAMLKQQTAWQPTAPGRGRSDSEQSNRRISLDNQHRSSPNVPLARVLNIVHPYKSAISPRDICVGSDRCHDVFT